MAAATYLAQFGNAAGDFFAAAFAWSTPFGPLLPPAWWQALRSNTEADVALRLTAGKNPHIVLLLTADRANTLQALLNALDTTTAPAGIKRPGDAVEFDALTHLDLPHEHLHVNHEGYHRDGQPLGCDFRLYAAWVGQGLSEGMAYQVALRSHRPNAEQERRVRKYVARLELEQPYTPPVREMQQILSRRLLAPGWLADEYLLFPNAALRQTWQECIATHFLETTGRIGFPGAPMESGDFSDWLAIGCHTARDAGVPSALPVQAACTFSDDEVAWLVRQNLTSPASGTASDVPRVFVSYASADFADADATRQYLESAGWRCWIAPRDVNTSGMPYTEAITRAIREVRAVVVLLSPSANLSVHIPREI